MLCSLSVQVKQRRSSACQRVHVYATCAGQLASHKRVADASCRPVHAAVRIAVVQSAKMPTMWN